MVNTLRKSVRGSCLRGLGFGVPEFQSSIPRARDQSICIVVSTCSDYFWRGRTDFFGVMDGRDRVIVVTEVEDLFRLEL